MWYSGSTSVSKTADGGSIPSTPAIELKKDLYKSFYNTLVIIPNETKSITANITVFLDINIQKVFLLKSTLGRTTGVYCFKRIMIIDIKIIVKINIKTYLLYSEDIEKPKNIIKL